MARKITTEIFIEEMKQIHKDYYDYSKVVYKNVDTKVCIICPKHGEFYMLPSNHRAGYGCPKCSEELRIHKLKDSFIKDSIQKFGEYFDYSKVSLTSKKDKVILICPKHGEFSIRAENHLKSEHGCPKCSRNNPRKPVLENVKRRDMREYRIWKSIKTRTTNPNINCADRYSKRGITCCERWLNSFENFYNDMGKCPDGYTIDRIDNNKGYFPENCRWANMKTQSSNRGDFNIIIPYKGETHVLKEWAEILGIKYTTLYTRMHRGGLSFEEAIKEDPYNRLVEYNGTKKSLKELASLSNIPYSTLLTRLNKHKWTLEEALNTPYKGRRSKI